jgi:hypothetical protein
MDGFRFWNSGYWKEHLNGRPYHISALYVVDLKRFRQLAAGDRLREQYQGLSRDPNSLSNLDQDLPNNMVHQVSQRRPSTPQRFTRTLIHVPTHFSLTVTNLLRAHFTLILLRHLLTHSPTHPLALSCRFRSSRYHRSGCGARRGARTRSSPKRKRSTSATTLSPRSQSSKRLCASSPSGQTWTQRHATSLPAWRASFALQQKVVTPVSRTSCRQLQLCELREFRNASGTQTRLLVVPS